MPDELADVAPGVKPKDAAKVIRWAIIRLVDAPIDAKTIDALTGSKAVPVHDIFTLGHTAAIFHLGGIARDLDDR